jgi:ribose/xylose/arabinose/galactoside ABC-type transport system permease subunit
MVFYFTVQTGTFLNTSNLLNILRGSVIVLIIALALTMVISSGGIDLSVGVALDFGAWFAIVSMASFGVRPIRWKIESAMTRPAISMAILGFPRCAWSARWS